MAYGQKPKEVVDKIARDLLRTTAQEVSVIRINVFLDGCNEDFEYSTFEVFNKVHQDIELFYRDVESLRVRNFRYKSNFIIPKDIDLIKD